MVSNREEWLRGISDADQELAYLRGLIREHLEVDKEEIAERIEQLRTDLQSQDPYSHGWLRDFTAFNYLRLLVCEESLMENEDGDVDFTRDVGSDTDH